MTNITEYQQWQTERHEGLTKPAGNLALVDYVPVKEGTSVPAFDAQATLVEGGIELTAGSDVLVEGKPVDGTTFVGRLDSSGGPLITRGDLTADVFSLDGTDYEIRIYDAHSPNLSNFERIEYYEYEDSLVVPASFVAYDDPDSVPWAFTRSSDTGHNKKVPGEIKLTIEGQEYSLLAFLDGEALVLTFADATTGSESYPPGRFLRLDAPAADGSLTVDFNRSFIPPCGFSTYYSCPLPPPQNRIAASIRGGEKRIVWKDEA